MTEFVLRIIFHIIYGCLLWSSQHMVLVLLIINYPNRDIFLIFLIQTSLLTTSKSEQNCYTVFLLHVTISPQAGVNPISSIIKQSRRSHRWWGLLQAPWFLVALHHLPRLFSHLICEGQCLIHGTVIPLRGKYILLLSLTWGYTWHFTDFYVLRKKPYPSPHPHIDFELACRE